MILNRTLRLGIVAQGGAEWTGGIEYTKNLVRAVGSHESRKSIHLVLIFIKGMDESFFEEILPNVDQVVRIGHPKLPRNKVKAFIKKVLMRLNLVDSPIFSLSQHLKLDFVYPVPALHAFGKFKNWAAWIPDLQHCALPQFFSASEIVVRNSQYRKLARTAPKLVFSSEASREDFTHYFKTPRPAQVLRFSVTPRTHDIDWEIVVRKYRLPSKFLIVSNQFWQHKNHLTVFRAIATLNDRGLSVPVVFTGGLTDYRKPGQVSGILETVNHLGIAAQVYLMGLLPKEEQVSLLRAAAAVVQPSLFEGWSTVVEDAKSFGKHIFLSDLRVHREQSPGNCDFFEALDHEALAELIRSRWEDLKPGPDLIAEQKARETSLRAWGEFSRSFLALAFDRKI